MIKAMMKMMTKSTTTVVRRRPPIRHLLAMLAGLVAGAGFADQPGQPLSAQEAFALPQPEPDEVIAYGSEARQFGELRMPEGCELPHADAYLLRVTHAAKGGEEQPAIR